MKIQLNDFNHYRNQPVETDGNSIDVVSTSMNTTVTSPIILRRSEGVKVSFSPTLVNNEKLPEKSLSGKLVYERKKKKDNEFPIEKITRQSVKVGEVIELLSKFSLIFYQSPEDPLPGL